MMFVLIVHADFIALGAPDVSDWASRPVGVVSQYLFECLAILAIMAVFGKSGSRTKRFL